MSTENQARALMVRHQQLVKRREQAMLGRAASDVGLPSESGDFWNHVQRQPHTHLTDSYESSQAGMS
jgi:hypothetical protein